MFTLTPAVIRGVESQGMLCSADELGVSDRNYQEEDGILILNRIFSDVQLGQDVKDVLGFEKIQFLMLHQRQTGEIKCQLSVLPEN